MDVSIIDTGRGDCAGSRVILGSALCGSSSRSVRFQFL
jgi:predicted aconitase with swiveling domain